ncbi:MAG TPA: DUF427 domain-containing protein [Polyangiaceae bacterium]
MPTTKEPKIPGPDHPITITPNAQHVVVKVAGKTIADTRMSLSLQEASYPAVLYVPRGDIDMDALVKTEHQTYCPYKGECSYYSIPAGGDRSVNAIWSYESPYASVEQIKDHMAFYPDRVDSIEIEKG